MSDVTQDSLNVDFKMHMEDTIVMAKTSPSDAVVINFTRLSNKISKLAITRQDAELYSIKRNSHGPHHLTEPAISKADVIVWCINGIVHRPAAAGPAVTYKGTLYYVENGIEVPKPAETILRDTAISMLTAVRKSPSTITEKLIELGLSRIDAITAEIDDATTDINAAICGKIYMEDFIELIRSNPNDEDLATICKRCPHRIFIAGYLHLGRVETASIKETMTSCIDRITKLIPRSVLLMAAPYIIANALVIKNAWSAEVKQLVASKYTQMLIAANTAGSA